MSGLLIRSKRAFSRSQAGVVLKGYGVGDLQHVRLKPSLPDILPDSEGPAVILFDSQKPFEAALRHPSISQSAGHATSAHCTRCSSGASASAQLTAASDTPASMAADAVAQVEMAAAAVAATSEAETFMSSLLAKRASEVRGILSRVCEHMGVVLVGVDVVIDSDGRCMVVDVNHMSGAPHSVPGFTDALLRLVRQHVTRQRAAARDAAERDAAAHDSAGRHAGRQQHSERQAAEMRVLPERFRALADDMPSPIRRLLVERCSPEEISATQLLEAMGMHVAREAAAALGRAPWPCRVPWPRP